MKRCFLVMLTGLCAVESVASRPLEAIEDSDFYFDGAVDPAKFELGRSLFFDKILSGNKNIACSTCHHPSQGTSDGLALPLGEGARGFGPERQVGAEQPVLGRVPRNSQALYMLGAREFDSLFHDGRVEPDPQHTWPSGFWSPAREQLPAGLDNALAAQAMFPVTSPIEMAGHKGENPVATAVANDLLGGPEGVWALLARRLQAIPDYVALFRAAYPDIEHAQDITFVHAANAIAAFEASAFRADESPFDLYLRTNDKRSMSLRARRGMDIFYGRGGCSTCHSGKFLTDQQFHAIAMPQIGPGKDDGWDQSYWQASGFALRVEDQGRYDTTQDGRDRYKFRTPTLRNVALTGPWGHAGTYDSLEAVVRHHADPVASLHAYGVSDDNLVPVRHFVAARGTGSTLKFDPVDNARLEDFLARDTWVSRSKPMRDVIADANELAATPLGERDVADVVAFLHALTDPRSADQQFLVPDAVPSGLAVGD